MSAKIKTVVISKEEMALAKEHIEEYFARHHEKMGPVYDQVSKTTNILMARLKSEVYQVLTTFEPHITKALNKNECSPFLIIAIGIVDRYSLDYPDWLKDASAHYLSIKFSSKEKSRGANANAEKIFKQIRIALIYEFLKELRVNDETGKRTRLKLGNTRDLLQGFLEHWYKSQYPEERTTPIYKTVSNWLTKNREIIKVLLTMEDQYYSAFDVPLKEVLNYFKQLPKR